MTFELKKNVCYSKQRIPEIHKCCKYILLNIVHTLLSYFLLGPKRSVCTKTGRHFRAIAWKNFCDSLVRYEFCVSPDSLRLFFCHGKRQNDEMWKYSIIRPKVAGARYTSTMTSATLWGRCNSLDILHPSLPYVHLQFLHRLFKFIIFRSPPVA